MFCFILQSFMLHVQHTVLLTFCTSRSVLSKNEESFPTGLLVEEMSFIPFKIKRQIQNHLYSFVF